MAQSIFNTMLPTTWTIRKRTLGVLIIVVAIVAVIGILVLDAIRADKNGLGPAQKLALAGCGGLALLGITLVLVGVDPLEGPNENSLQTAWPQWMVLARRVLLGIAAALLVFHLVVYVVYAVSLVSFPFDYDQGEGFELNDTVLLSQGHSPYRQNEIYPFYASNYPPLYHVLLIPFVWLFGPQYWYGRIVGFIATLITAAAIGYAVNRSTHHKAISLLSGLAYLASNYIYHVGPLFRQHIMMVMFEVLAIVVIAGIDFKKSDLKRQRRLIIAGLVLLLAAGFTKQLAIATAIAVFVYLFMNIPRRAILWAIVFGGIAGGLFLLLNVMTHGEWWLNTITANVNEYIVFQFRGLLNQFIGLHGALLIMAGLYMLYELYFDRISLYSIWLVATAIDMVSAGKWGAGDSYFATTIAAMCILAGLFTARTLQGTWNLPTKLRNLTQKLTLNRGMFVRIAGLACCLLFILYGLAVFKMPLDGPIFGMLAQTFTVKSNTKFANFWDAAGWTMGYATIGQIPSAEDVSNGWKIINAVKSDPRPIMSEEAAFSFLTGKPVVTNPTQLLNLYKNGHYDPTELVKMIDQQAFGAVIYRAGFYPEPVLAAVKRNYKGAMQIDMNGYEYTILYPAKPES